MLDNKQQNEPDLKNIKLSKHDEMQPYVQEMKRVKPLRHVGDKTGAGKAGKARVAGKQRKRVLGEYALLVVDMGGSLKWLWSSWHAIMNKLKVLEKNI